MMNPLVCCFRPHYSLRRQLWVSFGLTTAISISIVIVLATSSAIASGNLIKEQSSAKLSQQVLLNIAITSQYLADTITKKMDNLGGVVGLMAEATRDRIVGYPLDGWDDDRYIPFMDTISGRNKYPIKSQLLPQDWNIQVNVNMSNYEEHVQDRYAWYEHTNISTVHAAYRFQGNCNPDATVGDRDFFERCTAANNNATSGGVLFPTKTNAGLSRKAADLSVFLKPLYEAHPDIRTLGIFFANEGAGSSVVFPGTTVNGTSEYTSLGCEASLSQINQLTGQPFLSRAERDKCHPTGSKVPARAYNPLERMWCQDQIIEEGKTTIVGPYLDAFVANLWLVTFGQAVFDRRTGELVACTLVDVSINRTMHHIETLVADREFVTDVAVVTWDDGTVIASPQWDSDSAITTINVDNLDFFEKEEFQMIKALVDFEQPWDPNEVRDRYRNNLIKREKYGRVVSVYPIPVPPDVYDPNYRPTGMLIISVGEELNHLYTMMGDAIDDGVIELIYASTIVGCLGMGAVLLTIWFVVRVLTQPLEWMERTSKRIINSSEQSSEQDEDEAPFFKYTPKTEITSLVTGFNRMIKSFSGTGPAKVAHSRPHEIRNLVTWQKEFESLYFLDVPEGTSENFKKIDRAERMDRETSAASTMSIESEGLPIDPSIPKDIMTAGDPALPMASKTIAQTRKIVRSSFIPFTNEYVVTEDDTEETTDTNEKGDIIAKKITDSVNAEMALREPHVCPARLNQGRNMLARNWSERDAHYALQHDMDKSLNVRRSPLFRWIVGLIVVPILLTMATITALVAFSVNRTLPTLLKDTEALSKQLSKDNFVTAASARADFAEEVMTESVRDLHLHSRFASWLLFGGIEFSGSLTELDDSSEECKAALPNRSCSFFNDNTRSPCDCNWKNFQGFTCEVYENSARTLQKRSYSGQAHDADIVTGDRNSTTYPKVDFQPEATLWWNNFSAMPGFSQAPGWQSTYGRVHLLSAMAVVEFPIFNYEAVLTRLSRHIGIHVGLEADGMIMGYDGCEYSYAQHAHFQSSAENRAFEVRGDLCPQGKFGYDSRCRDWYASGKAGIHITPPYIFAGTQRVACSVTSPLFGPDEEYVGQSLIDFVPQAIYSALQITVTKITGRGFAIVITPDNDALGGDTVFCSGYDFGTIARPIQSLTLPHDGLDSDNLKKFSAGILKDMKAGSFDNAIFLRRNEGGSQEKMFITYSPVKVRSLSPVDSSDFSRGVRYVDKLVYSVAFVVPVEELTAPYDRITDIVSGATQKTGYTFFMLIAVTAVVVLIITSMIAITVTRPMMSLLKIVESINEKSIQEELPPMTGGSREVNQVYNSFAKLYKVVRFSNMAFFSGNMFLANKFLKDALKLFRNVDDKKAIAIAANNLGSTLLSIYHAKAAPNKCCMLDGKCIRCVVQECYNEAIDLGTEEYERSLAEFTTHEVRTVFTQQLANRLFNRGLFLLISREDPCSPADAIDQGIADLIRTRDFDNDVRDYWIATRQVKRNSGVYYERLLRRCLGLTIPAVRCEYLNDDWDVRDLLHEADSLLAAVGPDDSSPMFQDMNPIARLQQLEENAIRKKWMDGEGPDSANIAIRMLVEDEFLLEPAFVAAARAFTASFAAKTRPVSWDDASIDDINDSLRAMAKKCKAKIDIGKNVIFVDSTSSKNGSEVRKNMTTLYVDICDTDDFVGLVVCDDAVCEDMSFPLSCKKGMQQEHLASLAGERSCSGKTDLNAAFQAVLGMIRDAPAVTRRKETWVILSTDAQTLSGAETGDWNIEDVFKGVGDMINIVIVGVELKFAVDKTCKRICSEKNSLYINAFAPCVDAAFGEVANHIQGSQTLGGITMETF